MRTEKPWKPDAVLMLGSAIFFCLFITVSLTFGLNHFFSHLSEDTRTFLSFLTNSVGFQGMVLVLVAVFLRQHSATWSDFLGLNQPQLFKRLLFALVIGVLTVPLALGINKLSLELLNLLQLNPQQQASVQVLRISINPWQRVCFAVVSVILAPISEEVLFRGILYPCIKQLGKPRFAAYSSSLLFAAIHINLMTFVPLFLFALIMIWLYEKTGTLLSVIVAHALFNGINFTFYVLEPQIQELLRHTT